MSQDSLFGPERFWRLAVITVASGAIVMALEIAGSRIITPIFGSTTYTWGILIGVVLSGLTIGYHLGGRVSGFSPDFGKLCSIVFSTGIFIVFIPFIADGIIEVFVSAFSSSVAANFFVTLALFCPPSILAGFVSPYAIKLGTANLQKVGNTSGNLYSLATLGSIFGTFFTVFVLIPFFEINHIIIGLGISLMLISSLGLRKAPKIILGMITAILILSYLSAGSGIPSVTGVLFERESPYSSIKITEEGDFRTLYVDGVVHSTMDLRDPNGLELQYTRFFHLAKLLNPDLESVLFVGGGGFSGPKNFVATYPGISVDVVEIDPVVVDVARRYFLLPDDPALTAYTEDARQFMTNNKKRYDAVILDAYSGSSIPFHLLTLEYYQLLNERLNPDGVVVSNFIGTIEGSNAQLFNANYRTMSEVFAAVHAFPNNINNVDYRQNISIVALKDGNMDDILAGNVECTIHEELTCGEIAENHFVPSINENAPILTDQFSPVDHLAGYFIQTPAEIQQRWEGSELFEDHLLVKVGMLVVVAAWIAIIRQIWRGGALAGPKLTAGA